MTMPLPLCVGLRCILGDLTLWQYVVMFLRVYAGLWIISAAGYFTIKVMCFETFADVEWLLDFRLPDALFSRLTPSPTHEYRAEVPKNP